MLVNKKLGRFKQWAGERMGGEIKTNVSDDFKALEMEMNLRQEGMDKLQKAMTTYVKTLSKRSEAEDKEKILPVANLGSTMINHGEDYEDDSEFGQCLKAMGRANERIARIQEGYVQQATSTWLESLERSLVQMKEYQNARKKLETRRLGYDTSLTKMQKAKKEDFRVEEELRSQKAKYEESSEDVLRRMEDIKEAEADSVADLGAFLDAELEYYDKCREVMMRLKRDWPVAEKKQAYGAAENKRLDRSRPSASNIYNTRTESSPERPSKQPIRANRQPPSRTSTFEEDDDIPYRNPPKALRQVSSRSNPAFEGLPQLSRESSPVNRLARVTAEATPSGRYGLRQTDTFGENSDESFTTSSSPEYSRRTRSASPATSLGSHPNESSTKVGGNTSRRAPPPPPNRAKKPPPPPPMKRSALSSGNVLSN
ncbi:MAG: hypothetical protein M1814_003201 [Vezdaea aestivalis]|nr:MAG: hypothetical protein M1814_003201 [Vezdaea aestivalis]